MLCAVDSNKNYHFLQWSGGIFKVKKWPTYTKCQSFSLKSDSWKRNKIFKKTRQNGIIQKMMETDRANIRFAQT